TTPPSAVQNSLTPPGSLTVTFFGPPRLRELHSFPTRRSSDLCATGRLAIVTAPTITIRMEITIATIGRLIKNFDMAQFPSPERRSEEHTSELQSRGHLVCRLLLEKKNMCDVEYRGHV